MKRFLAGLTLVSSLGLLGTLPASADGGITFTDIAASAGIVYDRVPSVREAERLAIFASAAVTPIPTADFGAIVRPESPEKSRGAPGVAIFDFDNDGDLDIYATNGPGRANSLFKNLFVETGVVSFVDVATEVGVDATDQESSGVCVGDIDNDGRQDLFVVGLHSPHRLFVNRRNGRFVDVTERAGVGGDLRYATACSFGDLDNDGRLDLVVSGTYDDWGHRKPVFNPPGPNYPGLEHNQLFLNLGGHRFRDISDVSGIKNVSNMQGPNQTGAAHTWAIAMVDLDLDGNIDVMSGDNQAAGSTQENERRGWNRWFKGDGAGNVTDVTLAHPGLMVENSWMGFGFGDVNCDGRMDFFSTGMGNYLGTPGLESALFIQKPDGDFQHEGIFPNPFGWGAQLFDYDNDGDSDILYHGGMDILNLIAADNPGVLLQNNGVCSNTWTALAEPSPFNNIDHRLRTVEGVATGDLNNDGFSDIVTVSSFNIAPGNPNYRPMINLTGPTGGPYDPVSQFQNLLTGRIVPNHFVPVAVFPELPNGTLSVEISSANNGNGWVKFLPVGNAGFERHRDARGVVNRDGIGAVLTFTPDGLPTSMYPITGGSSYASSHAFEAIFGLGAAPKGTVEVVWPGGYKNRLYDVAAGETLTLPAIPCSFDGEYRNRGHFERCLANSLDDYRRNGYINNKERNRLRESMRRAYDEAN
jgi:enediyne biosynthesis protein E4